jgi:hypothetical protein
VQNEESNGGILSESHALFITLKQCDDEMAELETKLKLLKTKRDETEKELVTLMDDSLVSRLTVGDCTFYRRTDRYPRPQSQEDLFTWLNQIGRGDMIKPGVNSQSLRSLCLELLRENQPVPEHIQMFDVNRVQIKRS